VISKVEESKEISFKVDGQGYIFRLDEFTEWDLKLIKGLVLRLLGDVLTERDRMYECIRRINGELDRRVNEKACKE